MTECPYKQPSWAIDWTERESGRGTGLIEDICKHGVGHPNQEWMQLHDPDGKKRLGIHGCCGCCFKKDKTTRGVGKSG